MTDGTTEQLFWFAVDLPGMPVQYVTRVDGRVVATVSVVENVDPIAVSGQPDS